MSSVRPLPSGLRAFVVRVGELLYRPSSDVVDAAERQHARLLAKLNLANCLFMLFGAVALSRIEEAALAEKIRGVLVPAAALVLVAYGFNRSRFVRTSAVLSVAIQFAIPFAILGATRGTPHAHLFDTAAWSILALLIGSSLLSARGTALTIVATLVVVPATLLFGPAEWATDVPRTMLFVAGVGLLVVISHVHRDRVEAARAAELLARNRELEALKESLEERIEARTLALSQRNADMRLVLDNVDQALFTIDRAGVIASERSLVLTKFFGAPADGDTIADYFGRIDPPFAARLGAGWEQVVDGLFPVEASLDQLPKSLVRHGRHYAIGYQPIGTDEPDRFLVVVTDVTDEAYREVAERDKHETFALLEHALNDGAAMRQFLEEGGELVASLGGAARDVGAMLRALHTLKGNAASYGLKSIADLCHELETIAADTQRAPRRAEVASLKERWAKITREMHRLLGARRGVLEIAPADGEAFERALELRTSHQDLLAAFRAFKLEPIEPRLNHFADQAKRIAARLGKPALEVQVSAGGVRLEPRIWGPFLSTLIHAVRNAVDHGIESPETREARGKRPNGKLLLGASNAGGALTFEIGDDGAGIDWPALEARCRARGVSAANEAELVRALFADGISTSDVVTDISGRGAGMGALLEGTRALGGDIHVDSVRGAGTRLRIVFPPLALATDPAPSNTPRASLRPHGAELYF